MPRRSLERRSPVTGLTPTEELAFALRIKPREFGAEAEHERRYLMQRDWVLAVLTRAAAKHAHITTMASENALWSRGICIHSPVGQLTWGLRTESEACFDYLPQWTCQWDRHNASQRDARLRKLLALPTAELLAWLTGRSLASQPKRRRQEKK